MSCYPASASPGQIFSLFLCCSGGNDGMRLKMMSTASIDCRLHCFHKYLFWIKSQTEGSRSSTHGLVVFQKRTWTVTPARTNLNTGFYTSYQAHIKCSENIHNYCSKCHSHRQLQLMVLLCIYSFLTVWKNTLQGTVAGFCTSSADCLERL